MTTSLHAASRSVKQFTWATNGENNYAEVKRNGKDNYAEVKRYESAATMWDRVVMVVTYIRLRF